MKKNHFLIVFLFNLILASAFYIEGLKSDVTAISGDLANIIPICKKIDNPSLYTNDLYLDNLENVKYYTPFYIQTLRFVAKFTFYDYVQALNVLGFFTHILYGLLWFSLFYTLSKDFWLAFIFSVFFRGIIWPPGMELFGISDIWTIMPRTLFVALIPIPFLLFIYLKDKLLFLAPLVLGLLVNFHPISGVGCVLLYISIFLGHSYFENKILKKDFFIKFSLYLILILIGMLPYLLSYFTNVKFSVLVNQNLFNEAFRARIDGIFFDGFLFFKSWFKPVTYFFGTGLLAYYFIDSSKGKKKFKIIFVTILLLLVVFNALPFLENSINNYFKTNLRFSFQLIRAQKFVMILMQIATFLLLVEMAKKFKITNKLKIAFCIGYLFLISLSTAPIVNKLPLLGEDITTYIYPNNLKFFPIPQIENKALLDVYNYVNQNLPLDAVFYTKDIFFRTATNRAEVLDFHAAGMLIEGNQKAYTDLFFTLKKFKICNELDKIKILKTKKVNFIIDKTKWTTLELVFKNSEFYIYKL